MLVGGLQKSIENVGKVLIIFVSASEGHRGGRKDCERMRPGLLSGVGQARLHECPNLHRDPICQGRACGTPDAGATVRKRGGYCVHLTFVGDDQGSGWETRSVERLACEGKGGWKTQVPEGGQRGMINGFRKIRDACQ